MIILKKHDYCYMQCAVNFSQLSKAVRKKVGAVIVTEHGVIIPGVNGTPSGCDNCCEIEDMGELVTKPEVIHAELNCILKAAKEGVSIVGGTLYVSLSPCLPCSAMIKQSGIKRVVYLEEYRCKKGVDFLNNNGIITSLHKF